MIPKRQPRKDLRTKILFAPFQETQEKSVRHRGAFKKGMWAEAFGFVILSLKGYRILAKRYRTKAGEIDLIACKRQTVVMVEIKARRTETEALEAVSMTQEKRIERAADCFIASYPKYAGYSVRFDILLVIPWKWRHIKNAWWARY